MADNSKTIICFGDSLVFGYRIPREEKWTALLSGMSGYTVSNRGVCSEATTVMIKRFQRQVLRKKPGRLILIGGYNDIFQTYKTGTALENLEKMTVSALKEGISVTMCTPPPIVHPFVPPYWDSFVNLHLAVPLTKKLCDDIRGLYSGLSGTYRFSPGVSLDLCDLEKVFLGLENIRYYYLDEIHQNAEGQKIIAGTVYRHLIDQH